MTTNLPDLALKVAFNADPLDPASLPTWTDLSSRMLTIGSAQRGRQYELDTNQAGNMDVTFLNNDEALNPANASSPYAGQLLPYRRIAAVATWPASGVGNMLNTNNLTDPTFESYAVGQVIPWLASFGTADQAVGSSTTPFQGSRCASYNVTVSGFAGVSFGLLCVPGRTYTASAYVRQTAANFTEVYLSSGTGTLIHGTNTTTTGAWVRLSVTFTALWIKHTLVVNTAPVGTAGVVLVDAIQLELGGSVSAFTATGPVVRSIWTAGYAERWPVEWVASGFRGMATIPCVGPLAIMNNGRLSTEIRSQIMVNAPALYWPLQESGGTTFAETSGGNGSSMSKVDSVYGASSTFETGVQTAVLGDQGGSVVHMESTQAVNSAVSVLAAGYGNATPIKLGSATFPYSITATITVSRTAHSVGTYLLTAQSLNGQYMPFYIQAVPGSVNFGVSGPGGGAIAATGVDFWFDGIPHQYTIVVTITSTGSTVTGYIDGAVAAATTTTATGGNCPAATTVQAGGLLGPNKTTFPNIPGGQYCHVAAWNSALTAQQISDMGTAKNGWQNQSVSTRFRRIVARIGYIDPVALFGEGTNLGVSPITEGQDALSALQMGVDSDFGNLYEQSWGPAFASRASRFMATTPVFTFGERDDLGEYPYQGDVRFDLDPTHVVNVADVERIGGVKAHAEDAASQKRYGPKGFSRTINNTSDGETIDAANYVIATQKAPVQRLATLTFDPAATRVPFGDGTLWPMVLVLEIGMRVRVMRRPKAANSGAGITMQRDYFVESIDHNSIDFEAGTWLTTVQLSPAGFQPWILEDATYGLLESTTYLAF